MTVRRAFLLSACILLGTVACKDSTFGGLTETLSAEIVNPDTTIFEGTTATFVGVAVYGIGPGEPSSIAWGTDDTTKLRLVVSAVNRTLRVTGVDTGQAYIFAIINEAFRDSVLVTVVGNGELRWRRPLAGTTGLNVAVDDSGTVLPGRAGVTGTAYVGFSALGDTVRQGGGCVGYMGPSLRGLAIVGTTSSCTQENGSADEVLWTVGFGHFDGGVALAADGAALTLSHEPFGGSGMRVTVLTRLSPGGGVLWRDTLATTTASPDAAPAIASNGDVYVQWRDTLGASRVSRFTGAGTRRWTFPLPEFGKWVTPALAPGRVVVTYRGGLMALDSAGTELWRRQFMQDNPAATATTRASSAVLDPSGNVYVQTEAGLHSYDAAGQPRWVADSLGGGSTSVGVGAPTLLLTDRVLVHCGGDVCSVIKSTGALEWRSPPIGNVVSGVAVGPNGEIYVLRGSGSPGNGELIALWGNRVAEFNGWPTEGADQRRSRRRL